MFASKWEELYSQYLTTLRNGGDIVDFVHEPMKLVLASKTTYLPDFLVIRPGGLVEFHEVKGFVREDAIIKFKFAAAKFPWFTFVMLKLDHGQWVEMHRFSASNAAPSTSHECVRPSKSQVVFPKNMTYKKMQENKRLSPILKMSPRDWLALRVKLGLSPAEMAAAIDLVEVSYRRIEAGTSNIYHYKHVLNVYKLINGVKDE